MGQGTESFRILLACVRAGCNCNAPPAGCQRLCTKVHRHRPAKSAAALQGWKVHVNFLQLETGSQELLWLASLPLSLAVAWQPGVDPMAEKQGTKAINF